MAPDSVTRPCLYQNGWRSLSRFYQDRDRIDPDWGEMFRLYLMSIKLPGVLCVVLNQDCSITLPGSHCLKVSYQMQLHIRTVMDSFRCEYVAREESGHQ